MSTFSGFPKEGLALLAELAANNNKAWFEAHRSQYQTHLLEPAQAFVAEVGARLQSIAPDIRYDTRTDGRGSLMRIYRDIRFSKDKSPYKTAIAGMFWDGEDKKMSSAGFGFHMEPTGMDLMAGTFEFMPDKLEAFRRALENPTRADALQAAADAVRAREGYQLGGQTLKRVPQSYPADHPRAEWLRYTGLHALSPAVPPEVITSPRVVDVVFGHFQHMLPIQQWLAGL